MANIIASSKRKKYKNFQIFYLFIVIQYLRLLQFLSRSIVVAKLGYFYYYYKYLPCYLYIMHRSKELVLLILIYVYVKSYKNLQNVKIKLVLQIDHNLKKTFPFRR